MVKGLAVKVENLSKMYPGHLAVENLEFSIKAGTIHGFLGPNGAGKTTTLRLISGLLVPTSGRIWVDGLDLETQSMVIKKKLGVLLEQAPLYLDMTVESYLILVAKLHDVEKKRLKEFVEKAMEATRLQSVRGRLIGHLSKGMKQRVGLAHTLVFDPSILILDEPTSGLDPQSMVEMRELIVKLKKEKTIIFSSHLLSEVEAIADEVTIINQGKIRANGPLETIKSAFNRHKVVHIQVAAIHPGTIERLNNIPYVESLKVNNDTQIILEIGLKTKDEKRGDLVRFLVNDGVDVLGLTEAETHLETIFLQLTSQMEADR